MKTYNNFLWYTWTEFYFSRLYDFSVAFLLGHIVLVLQEGILTQFCEFVVEWFLMDFESVSLISNCIIYAVVNCTVHTFTNMLKMMVSCVR